MRRWAALVILVVLGVAIIPGGVLFGAQDGAQDAAECKSGSCGSDRSTPAYVPREVLVRFRSGIAKEQSVQALSAKGVESVRSVDTLGIEVMRLPVGLSVEEAVKQFNSHPGVEYAEPNYILHAAAPVIVDDPGLAANQWAPQMMDAELAWPTEAGDSGVVIAVVDSGVDYNHSELAPNMWPTYGYDFINNDADPMDDYLHGTHVAGIIAAADNENPQGLVGICPYCTIMAVKVLNATGSGPLDTVANGITYAVNNGADVINLSLGGTAGTASLQAAVDYAWNQGVVVVASAGNDGADVLFYPAAYDNAIAVASTDKFDRRSCYSNYGDGFIDVAAPGEVIYSTFPQVLGVDKYAEGSGTSMAAPHVAGLAGLLISKEPGLTNAEVRTRIETTTDDLGPLGTDLYFGTGRINADRAFTNDISSPLPPTENLAATNQTASRASFRAWA